MSTQPQPEVQPTPLGRRPVTDADKQFVKEGIARGVSKMMLARQMGRTLSVVQHIVAKVAPLAHPKIAHAHHRAERSTKRRDDIDAKEVRTMAAKGMTQTAIAKHFGVSHSPIIRLLGKTDRLSSEGRMRIRAAQKKRWAKKAPVLTAMVPKRKGFYHCPDRLENGRRCKVKYPELRFLGRHRLKHGVEGSSPSVLFKKKNQSKLGETKNGIQLVAKPVPSNSSAGTNPWTDDTIAGFVFAHVHNDILSATARRPDAQQSVTQRVSDLLHYEVHGQAQRDRGVRLLRSVS